MPANWTDTGAHPGGSQPDDIVTTGVIRSSSPYHPLGYNAGAGGGVTQATDATTTVILNRPTGQITTFALTTAAGAEERFTVTNSCVKAGDVPVFSTSYNGNGTPAVTALRVIDGQFDVVITNLHGSAALNALMVINFAVIRGRGV